MTIVDWELVAHDQERELASLKQQLAEANKRIRMLETANGTYATIERELVEAKKDAERYRWLLTQQVENDTLRWFSYTYVKDKHEDMNAAIDQAMKGE